MCKISLLNAFQVVIGLFLTSPPNLKIGFVFENFHPKLKGESAEKYLENIVYTSNIIFCPWRVGYDKTNFGANSNFSKISEKLEKIQILKHEF